MTMSDSHGRYVWYELTTTDTDAAKAFYGKVVGWGSHDAEMPGMTYTMLTAGELPVAGLMTQPEMARKAGAPPGWMGYVGVDDVDATADRAKRLGGAVHVAPADIPNVGRFAVIGDPQGAVLALFKWSNPTPEQPPQPGTPRRIGWHELMAGDWQKALAFYSDLFGWKKADAMDMGAMGTYQMFSAGGQTIGGMFTKPPEVPAPFWLYYINVGDFDAAVERAKAAGGTILNGPMEVPGGDWIVQAKDPQGAMFALVGKRG
jgi:predicted enzyme related to lactoylglutathione lyase